MIIYTIMKKRSGKKPEKTELIDLLTEEKRGLGI